MEGNINTEAEQSKNRINELSGSAADSEGYADKKKNTLIDAEKRIEDARVSAEIKKSELLKQRQAEQMLELQEKQKDEQRRKEAEKQAQIHADKRLAAMKYAEDYRKRLRQEQAKASSREKIKQQEEREKELEQKRLEQAALQSELIDREKTEAKERVLRVEKLLEQLENNFTHTQPLSDAEDKSDDSTEQKLEFIKSAVENSTAFKDESDTRYSGNTEKSEPVLTQDSEDGIFESSKKQQSNSNKDTDNNGVVSIDDTVAASVLYIEGINTGAINVSVLDKNGADGPIADGKEADGNSESISDCIFVPITKQSKTGLKRVNTGADCDKRSSSDAFAIKETAKADEKLSKKELKKIKKDEYLRVLKMEEEREKNPSYTANVFSAGLGFLSTAGAVNGEIGADDIALMGKYEAEKNVNGTSHFETAKNLKNDKQLELINEYESIANINSGDISHSLGFKANTNNDLRKNQDYYNLPIDTVSYSLQDKTIRVSNSQKTRTALSADDIAVMGELDRHKENSSDIYDLRANTGADVNTAVGTGTFQGVQNEGKLEQMELSRLSDKSSLKQKRNTAKEQKRQQRAELERLLAREKRNEMYAAANKASDKEQANGRSDKKTVDSVIEQQKRNDLSLIKERIGSDIRQMKFAKGIADIHFADKGKKGKKSLNKAKYKLSQSKRQLKRAIRLEKADNERYYEIISLDLDSARLHRKTDKKQLIGLREELVLLLNQRDEINKRLIELYSGKENGSRVGQEQEDKAKTAGMKRYYRRQMKIARKMERMRVSHSERESIFKIMDEQLEIKGEIAKLDFKLKKQKAKGSLKKECLKQRKKLNREYKYNSARIDRMSIRAFRNAKKRNKSRTASVIGWTSLVLLLAAALLGYFYWESIVAFIKGLIF